MEGQSSVSKQAKFSRRILCSKRRILRSPMLNEHPAYCREHSFFRRGGGLEEFRGGSLTSCLPKKGGLA